MKRCIAFKCGDARVIIDLERLIWCRLDKNFGLTVFMEGDKSMRFFQFNTYNEAFEVYNDIIDVLGDEEI